MDHSELDGLDPFDLLDDESRRVERHFSALEDWGALTRCDGWTARDMLSHLAGVEVYNRACLDDAVARLFAELAEHGVSDPHAFNAWFVQLFNARPVDEVLGEWRAANAAFRAEMRAHGAGASVATSIGHYPVPLQALHLAMEYATHADDLGAQVDPGERPRRVEWRARFARFAIAEQARSVAIRASGGMNWVRAGGESVVLSDEELVEASQGRLRPDEALGATLRVVLNYLP